MSNKRWVAIYSGIKFLTNILLLDDLQWRDEKVSCQAPILWDCLSLNKCFSV